ncbi:hypothetical protein Ndes2437A_g06406 [Nannochloris sp. 'desiccata']
MTTMRLNVASVGDRINGKLVVRKRTQTQPQAISQQENEPPIPITRSTLLKSGLMIGAIATLAPAISPVLPAAIAADAVAASTSVPAIVSPKTISQIVLNTLSDCKLAVSVYPTFGYNAGGGGGAGTVTQDPSTGLLNVVFDPETLVIPPITSATSTVLGIPIPPPLKIAIVPKKLEGTIDPETGEANLTFLAGFEFTAGPLYTAPPLVVSTTLTTEQSSGPIRSGTGNRLTADGKAKLVGVARVPKTGDGFLDGFLMLPTDALAVLSADLKFS